MKPVIPQIWGALAISVPFLQHAKNCFRSRENWPVTRGFWWFLSFWWNFHGCYGCFLWKSLLPPSPGSGRVWPVPPWASESDGSCWVWNPCWMVVDDKMMITCIKIITSTSKASSSDHRCQFFSSISWDSPSQSLMGFMDVTWRIFTGLQAVPWVFEVQNSTSEFSGFHPTTF